MDPMDSEATRKSILENAYGNAAPLNAGTITLGCEFEFVLTYHRQIKTHPGEQNPVDLILEALNPPHVMKCADPDCKEDFEFSLSAIPSNGDQYDKWQVGTDESVRPQTADLRCLGDDEQLDNFQFDPIEVRSRIFRHDETAERANQLGKHEHWITFQDEITLVLSLLNDRFGFGRMENAGSKYHILPTNRSGFHVHIANGNRLSVPFKTAKKVYSTFVACERQLDRLVGTRDITGAKLVMVVPENPISGISDLYKHMLTSAYSRPISAYLILAAHMRRQWDYGSPDKVLTLPLKEVKDVLDQLYPQTVSKTMKDFHKVKYGMDIDSWLTLVEGA